MHISFNYSELIQEFREELADHVLSPNDMIYVLREDAAKVVYTPIEGPCIVHYKPIIDWYYGDEDREEKYTECLIDEEDKKLFQESKEDFLAVRDKLEPITVEKCLEEMKAMSEIA